MEPKQYELIVIGSGPSGEKAAVKAAYFGHKVALVEQASIFGGAEVVTGTLPSKTLKETALFLSGKQEKGLFSIERDLSRKASIEDFMYRKNLIMESEATSIGVNLKRHGIDVYQGVASFEDLHTINVSAPSNCSLIADFILIATGSYPYHPSNIPFDGVRVHDSDTILQIKHFPKSLCVVGAGVIGCEYATIFSTAGSKVLLVNDKSSILSFVDKEVTKELLIDMKENGIETFFNEKVASIDVPSNENEPLRIHLESKQVIEADMFLLAAGRSGNVHSLNLEKVGIPVGPREQIFVNDEFRTKVPHIFAVGDVIGFPALASTSMEQGRIAVAYMFHTRDLEHHPLFFPYGIYTIPEISMVGLTEDEIEKKGVPFVTGKARYSDMPRGKIMGAKRGFLKLVITREDLAIRGVHIIGNIATELIHYGSHLVEDKKDLYFLISQVFNYPTFHDLYKYAAYDALSAIAGRKLKL